MQRRVPHPIALLSLAMLTTALCAGAAVAAMKTPSFEEPGGSGRVCGTPDLSQVQMLETRNVLESLGGQLGALAVGGQIKVAFHVIYNGSVGNVPQSQIDAQIAELNKAYAGFYGGANTGYTFVLASVDRTSNRKWFGMTPGSMNETQAKNALALDVPHRLNLYTCKPGQSLLGWAYFPQSYAENNKKHGVVIHYGSLPGGYLAPYNLGGTAHHEVGHYLGLYHTFQGGCVAPGDEVSDTPYEATATSGCPAGKNTCAATGDDPIHNYMDYSDDACYTEFTGGQDTRMDGIVPVYRPSLLNAAIAQGGAGETSSRPAVAPGAGVAFRGAFPNPFKISTVLRFSLPQREIVSLKVYNVAGQLVETLQDGELEPGERAIPFRGGTLPPGTYFASLKVGGVHISRSMILIR